MTTDEKRKWLEEQLKKISDDRVDNLYKYVTHLTEDISEGTGEWVNPPWSNEMRCRICGCTWFPIEQSGSGGFRYLETYLCPKGCKPDELAVE